MEKSEAGCKLKEGFMPELYTAVNRFVSGRIFQKRKPPPSLGKDALRESKEKLKASFH
jgi:hypothetical protein